MSHGMGRGLAHLLDPGLGGPDERARCSETRERVGIVALDARWEIVALPGIASARDPVELLHHGDGAVVTGDARIGSEMLPALLEALEGHNWYRLDGST